jgi:hypothetical protein
VRARRILATALLLAGLVAGCTLRRSVGPPPSPYCRSGSPLSGVYHPQRLDVKGRCRVAEGVVEDVKFEQFDGDVHIDLRLDDAYRGLLASGNDRVHGDLVVEIIPQDRAVVAVPEVGARIGVAGPWVDDTAHGWREIHPAWFVSAGRIVPASPEELRRARDLLAGSAGDADS